MYIDGKVWIGNNDQGERISIIPKMVNRHGLVAVQQAQARRLRSKSWRKHSAIWVSLYLWRMSKVISQE